MTTKKKDIYIRYVDEVFDLVGSENNADARKAASDLCDLLRDPVIAWHFRWVDRGLCFVCGMIALPVLALIARALS